MDLQIVKFLRFRANLPFEIVRIIERNIRDGISQELLIRYNESQIYLRRLYTYQKNFDVIRIPWYAKLIRNISYIDNGDNLRIYPQFWYNKKQRDHKTYFVECLGQINDLMCDFCIEDVSDIDTDEGIDWGY
eukprot:Lithocolla_globosa_v1_NODE_99_length_6376_cov_39.997943.p4 type:complete len:132 gc:universal NODE_99_length_6376_cov_39.997943:3713-3318(-)